MLPDITSAEVAAKKFFLRELLLFFIEKRKSVIGDDSFEFIAIEFITYLTNNEILTVMNQVNVDVIKKHLQIIRDLFCTRDDHLGVIMPKTKILDFRAERSGIFKVSNTTTEHLKNLLRFIDVSLNLGVLEEVVEDDEETGERNNSAKALGNIYSQNGKTLFSFLQDQRIQFLDKISDRALSTKERAIFIHLSRNFKIFCPYSDLFSGVVSSQRSVSSALNENIVRKYESASDRKTYINNGVLELKKKLFAISGNPHTVETSEGRISKYRLVY